MSFVNKKFIVGVSIFIAFFGIGVLGLLPFAHDNHVSEAPMVNCPYAEGEYAICKNSFEHIGNWQQFLNIIFPALTTFLLLACILYIFGQKFLNQQKYFYRWKYYLNNNKNNDFSSDILKWLSLFENSPSFSYVRHS